MTFLISKIVIFGVITNAEKHKKLLAHCLGLQDNIKYRIFVNKIFKFLFIIVYYYTFFL